MIEPSNERTDTMKGKITLIFIIALVVGGMVGFAGDGNGPSGNRCNPAGTWYQENPFPPYMATITPIQGHSQYSIFFQGVYAAPLFGFEVMTDYSGEIAKSGDAYYGACIALMGGGVTFPHWDNLEIWGVKLVIWFDEDCDTMYMSSPGNIHAWVWALEGVPVVPAPIPWVDDPDGYPLGEETGATEIYYRMALPTDYSVD
jgi:hypothetical protein